MLSIITPSTGRPEAFSLLERWVTLQDYPHAFEWVVAGEDHTGYEFTKRQAVYDTSRLEDGRHSLCRNLRTCLENCHGEQILILEDDDYYFPGYVATMVESLQTADIAGSFPARYYNVRDRRFQQMKNWKHASLAQTGLNRSQKHKLISLCGAQPFVDIPFWQWAFIDNFNLIPNHDLQISIKGMPGKPGVGIGHNVKMGQPDTDRSIFWQWKIPDVYLDYAEPRTDSQM